MWRKFWVVEARMCCTPASMWSGLISHLSVELSRNIIMKRHLADLIRPIETQNLETVVVRLCH